MTQQQLDNYLFMQEQQALQAALASYTRKGSTYEYHNFMHEAAAYADARRAFGEFIASNWAHPLP